MAGAPEKGYESSALAATRTGAPLNPARATYSFPSGNRIVGNDGFPRGDVGQVGTQDVHYDGFTGVGPGWP